MSTLRTYELLLREDQSRDLVFVLSLNRWRSLSKPSLSLRSFMMSIGSVERPEVTRSAEISPITLQNLYPCPEQGEHMMTYTRIMACISSMPNLCHSLLRFRQLQTLFGWVRVGLSNGYNVLRDELPSEFFGGDFLRQGLNRI